MKKSKKVKKALRSFFGDQKILVKKQGREINFIVLYKYSLNIACEGSIKIKTKTLFFHGIMKDSEYRDIAKEDLLRSKQIKTVLFCD